MAKVVFSFDDKSTKKLKNKKNTLGGKGANLGEMGRLGLPVPPGFTITTEVCDLFYKNKGIGLNAINSYKRASNILDKAGKRITGRPDAVLFRKDEEKVLHEKINEIRKAFTVKDDNKDYESLLIKLSDTKESTDNFFDNVVVNDENQDIKNNRLELLKMFCNTFDNFIDFSKLEGL